MTVRKATLKDGRIVEYVEVADPPAGGMKKTFFTPDRSSVVQFFHDETSGNDPNRVARLEAVVGKYNPTVSGPGAEYFRQLFCWPTAIVVKPFLGIMAPTYPKNYFFADGPFKGKEKEGRWFSSNKLRRMLPESERGNFLKYLQSCIRLTRAVRRMHQAGLAHSDLSCKNILIDPSAGQAVVIDIDSLVVPGIFPPDVAGTPGYIAPEVLGSLHLPLNDPGRKHPSVRTDQHALPVLLYEYLLFRHPLRGPKVNSVTSAEEDEKLSMGAKALFIENPTDKSNQPSELASQAKVTDLGKNLADLFERAFVKGLHSPNDRPGAIEWERGLIRTWDSLHPCPNPQCPQKWFPLHDLKNPRCPFCGTRVKGPIAMLKLRREVRPGQWLPDSELIVHPQGLFLFKWHIYDNIYPGEEADRTPQAYFAWHEGKWLLINQAMPSLTSPGGNRVPVGQAVELKDGATIRLSQEAHGRIAEVQVVG